MRDHGTDPSDSRHDANDAAWRAAFAALPGEAPPNGGWRRLAGALVATAGAVARRGAAGWRRAAGGLALAATLVLAVALPWQAVRDAPSPEPAPPVAAAVAEAPIDQLYAESARLEALLAHVREPQVASGAAMTMSAGLESRLAAIDSALAAPDLPPDRWEALWRERVAALEALAEFEGTRRWLAANGAQYDGAFVQVD